MVMAVDERGKETYSAATTNPQRAFKYNKQTIGLKNMPQAKTIRSNARCYERKKSILFFGRTV